MPSEARRKSARVTIHIRRKATQNTQVFSDAKRVGRGIKYCKSSAFTPKQTSKIDGMLWPIRQIVNEKTIAEHARKNIANGFGFMS